MRLILILIGVALVCAILTFLLHLIKVRWVKYVPSSLLLLTAIIMIIMAEGSTGKGMQDLGWIALAILSFAGAVGGGITAIVLDIQNRSRSK